MQLYFEFVVGQRNFSDAFGLDNSVVVKYFAVMTQSNFVVVVFLIKKVSSNTYKC